eukprot:gnl/TRDRNA2_/TRDRNA2_167896_c1_seq21.p1 gnl/TRDRNA2_/TRDRNA2_167896_c1~~gnl/TRDRNA2_/TRDRNA2_167896_c1_seq21.p1  ORF type:complete len:553 (-),score=87.48 gnl/TRDRNA2_/TRDRNA2_167896_c1_seq21:113-1771(-)
MLIQAPVIRPSTMPTRTYGQVVGTPIAQSCATPQRPSAPPMTTHQSVYMAVQQTPPKTRSRSLGQSLRPKSASPKNEHLSPDVEIWIKEARDFKLNADFDFSHALPGNRKLSLQEVFDVMKKESAGKRTIQALGDKLLLHRLLDNLGVPQLPHLVEIDGKMSTEQIKRAITQCVDKYLLNPDSSALFLKPSHLCEGAGACTLHPFKPQKEKRDGTIEYLVNHVQKFMGKKAGDKESEAMQSLKAGIIIQPRYHSVVRFKMPVELRVIAIWGRVREATWWWGTEDTPTLPTARNVWIVRRPKKADQLSDEDDWEFLHNHKGHNIGWDRAVELFMRHMPAMSKTTEVLATAVGAPWLRADYFVGDIELGPRLNEVAYGCGCAYRWKPIDGSQQMVDDAPAIAHILQEGMKVCQQIMAPQTFLSRLGAEGNTYSEMKVSPLPALGLRLMQENYPSNALQEGSDQKAKDSATSEDLCRTVKSADGPQTVQEVRPPPSPYRNGMRNRRMKPMPAITNGGYRTNVLSFSAIEMAEHPSAGLQVWHTQQSSFPRLSRGR